MTSYNTIDEYISAFPEHTQILLNKVRRVISETAPQAQECMNYGIPTFKMNGNLVHFAGYKKHIGFYPAPSGIIAFKNELSDYEYSKGAIKFPIEKDIPFDLIKRITLFRIKENLQKG